MHSPKRERIDDKEISDKNSCVRAAEISYRRRAPMDRAARRLCGTLKDSAQMQKESKNENFHLSNLPISTNSSCLQPANLAAKSCARRTAARHQWYRIFTCGGEGAGCPKCCVPSEIKVWYELTIWGTGGFTFYYFFWQIKKQKW